VALPGEDIDDAELRKKDERSEREYERRAEGKPAERAAAIAISIAEKRRDEEGGPEKSVAVPITGGTH
jgi:hypothetical protein